MKVSQAISWTPDREVNLLTNAHEREKSKRTFMSFVHELKQLVDNSFQEFPMRLQEPWVLADNVHDVGCHNSLVILASLDLAES